MKYLLPLAVLEPEGLCWLCAAAKDFEIHQVDIKTAFLTGSWRRKFMFLSLLGLKMGTPILCAG
jgi:hypothetical protein